MLGEDGRRGADMIIIDDPLKAEDASSKTVRDDVNEWYTTALVSRLNDKARDVMIVLMQPKKWAKRRAA